MEDEWVRYGDEVINTVTNIVRDYKVHNFLSEYYCTRTYCDNCGHKGITFTRKGKRINFDKMACVHCGIGNVLRDEP